MSEQKSEVTRSTNDDTKKDDIKRETTNEIKSNDINNSNNNDNNKGTTIKLKNDNNNQGKQIKKKTSKQVCDDFIRNLAKCLISEIQSSRIDYGLLRELNNKGAIEYSEMNERAKLLINSLNLMSNQETQLMNELNKIDDLVKQVNKLESVVLRLDQYTKNLHAQFLRLYQ